MHIYPKPTSGKNHDNHQKKTFLKDLGGEYTLPQKTINPTNNMDRLQTDWSGYFDELDPY